MLETASTNDLRFESLSDIFSYYERKWPRFSQQQIADKLDVSASIVSRIKNNKQVSLTSFLKVIRNIKSENPGRGIFKGELEVYFKKLNSTNSTNSKNQLISDKLSKLLLDSSYREVIIPTLSARGISETEALDMFGRNGLRKLQDLAEKKVIIILDNGNFTVSSENMRGTADIDKAISSDLVKDYYKHEYHGEDKNFCTVQIDSINKKEAMPAIRKVLNEAYSKINDIINEDIYKGDDNFFVTMVSDTLSFENKEKLQ